MSLMKSQRDTNPSSWSDQVPMDKSGMWINLCYSTIHVFVIAEYSFITCLQGRVLNSSDSFREDRIYNFFFWIKMRIYLFMYLFFQVNETLGIWSCCTLFWKEALLQNLYFPYESCTTQKQKIFFQRNCCSLIFLFVFGNKLFYFDMLLGMIWHIYGWMHSKLGKPIQEYMLVNFRI